MSNEEGLSEVNQIKLNQIQEKFEQLFKMKGYKLNSTFNSKVWFLKNDKAFQSLVLNQTPFGEAMRKGSPILDILMELNQNKDISNLKVPVDQFITKLSKLINDSNISINISDASIRKNESHEKISRINEILNLLTNRVQGRKKENFSSKLYASISSMQNFPKGAYKVNLKINTEFENEDYFELNESEKKNLNRNNIDNVFNMFSEKTLQTNNLITLEDNSITFRTTGLNNKKAENAFNEYTFGILEKDSNNYLVDRRYSGTTLSNFKLVLRKDNQKIFQSKNEYFLHLILSWVDDLCNMNRDVISKNIFLKIFGGNEKEERGVKLQMDFEIDDLTRIGLLNRIKELISIPVDTKVKNQMQIDEILSDYFPDIKDGIYGILNKSEENRDSCCNPCQIF